jgi:hypothetical protein
VRGRSEPSPARKERPPLRRRARATGGGETVSRMVRTPSAASSRRATRSESGTRAPDDPDDRAFVRRGGSPSARPHDQIARAGRAAAAEGADQLANAARAPAARHRPGSAAGGRPREQGGQGRTRGRIGSGRRSICSTSRRQRGEAITITFRPTS